MRKQLFSWFQELGIAKYLDLSDEDELFERNEFLKSIYVTSLLRDPVFILKNGKWKNYSGQSPKPWNDDTLFSMMQETISVIESISHPVLIIPMGKVVAEALSRYSDLVETDYVLTGFPHPSGSNGHRHKQFEENKYEMKKIIHQYFKRQGYK